MNSRERVLSSINRIEPDRVPFDLGGTSVTGISAMAYNKLKAKLGIDSPTRVFDVVQQLAMVDCNCRFLWYRCAGYQPSVYG